MEGTQTGYASPELRSPYQLPHLRTLPTPACSSPYLTPQIELRDLRQKASEAEAQLQVGDGGKEAGGVRTWETGSRRKPGKPRLGYRPYLN